MMKNKKKMFLESAYQEQSQFWENGSAKYRKQDSGEGWEEDLIRSRGIPLMGGSCVDPGHSTQFVHVGSQTVRLSAEIKSSPSCSRPADSAALRSLPADREATPLSSCRHSSDWIPVACSGG